MPSLLYFIPCEKALVTNANLVALIPVIENVTVTVPPDTELDASVMEVTPWHLVIQWRRLPDDSGRSYEQYFQFLAPDNRPIVEQANSLDLTHDVLRIILSIPGFPIGLERVCI